MNKEKIKIFILLIIFQFTFKCFSQDFYETIESEMGNNVCECMETRILKAKELNQDFVSKEIMGLCMKNMLNEYIPKLKSIPENKTKEEHSLFLTKVPHIASNKVFKDCPYVCAEINIRENYKKLVEDCEKEFYAGTKGLINFKKVCQCSTDRFIENLCDNNIIDDKEHNKKITKNSIKECIKENFDYSYKPTSENKNEIVEFYKETLKKDDSFNNINLDSFCNCYFSKMDKLKLTDDELIEGAFTESKEMKRITKKCKKQSRQ